MMAEKASHSKSKRLLAIFGKTSKSESSLSSTTPISSSEATPLATSSASSPPGIPTLQPHKQTVSEALSYVDQMRIDRIPLPHLLKHPSTNPAILKAQEELQKATEELQAELKKYADKFSEYAPLQEEDLISAVSSTREDSGGFRRVIEQVLSDQKVKSEAVPGKVGAFMGQMYPIAGFVLGIVSFGADATGVLPLKITANAVNTVLTTVSKQHTRSEAALASLPDLTQYDSFFSELQKRGYDRISDGLLEASTKLFVAITKLLRVILEFLDSNAILEALKSIRKDNLKDAKAALATAMTNLDAAVNQEALFDEKNREWREECEEAMKFLSELPVLKAHDNIRNLRMKDSGKWILQDETFLKWIDGEVRTIWCPGKPGAGKTFLCSTVIDYCRSNFRSDSTKEQGVGVAWMYCDYSTQSAQTIDGIIASLIKQLVTTPCQRKGRELMKEVTKFRQDYKGGSPSHEHYLRLLSHVVGSLSRSVVIIDALDECAEIDSNECNREFLIEELLKLKVQLLVTSRDLPIIKALFSGAPSFRHIPISPDPRDIESYIHWKVYDGAHGSPKLRGLVQKHPALLTDITTVVTEKYSQIFNLARLQMEKISKLTTYGAVKAALGELPVKENDFYDQSIKRIMSDESQAEQALRILAWILCAKTPMSLWDMRYASIIVPGNYSMNFEEFAPSEEDLVNCCHGLVVILPETRTLAFTHPTIKDYLESARKRVFPHDAEVIISSTCLTYLASDYLHSNMDQDLGIFPLFEYATSTWVEHVRGNYETEVLDFIIKLLERNPSLVLFKELENISLQKQDYFYPSPKATVHYPLTLDRDGVWIACKRGLEGTVKKLLERGAFWGAIEEPKCSNFTWGCREPILVAVAHKYPAVVQVLLEFGADANTRHHETGWTGLHLVAEQRRLWRSVQLLQVLLRGGADIEAEGNDGKTPLHVASYRGRANVVDFLLREGASIDARDKLGDTPLHTAGRRYKDNHAKISLLLERGSDVNAKNENGETVLHLAVAWSPVDVIRLLLETDVQIEAIDNKGQTALHIAAAGINQSRCKDRILSLLERGANVEARDKDARTPLHIAAQHGWVEAVEILLGKEPVIDAKEKLGRKAVDIARARLEGVEGPNPDANRTAQV